MVLSVTSCETERLLASVLCRIKVAIVLILYLLLKTDEHFINI